MNIEKELKKIEREEQAIEREEQEIERREDLLRVFEELGLMRWKSYYILTAGAILLLSLTFVTALWVMHDQMLTLQGSVDSIDAKISQLSTLAASAQTDWCPAGQTATMNIGDLGMSTFNIIGEETHNGKTMCHVTITSVSDQGTQTIDTWFDQFGNIDSSL